MLTIKQDFELWRKMLRKEVGPLRRILSKNFGWSLSMTDLMMKSASLVNKIQMKVALR